MRNQFQRIYKYYGLAGLTTKLQRRFGNTYKCFLKHENIPSFQTMEREISTFTVQPLISIITPLYKPILSELEAYFVALLEKNGYKKIELCLVNDGTDDDTIDMLITDYQARFPGQIKYQKNKKNRGISAASNDALMLASGEYVALVDQDDVVAQHALFEYVKALQQKSYDFFYSDEDMLSPEGKRFNPAFKPDWSPHTLVSRMYINHLSMYKKKIVDQVGGFRSKFDGAQDYDLLLRAARYFEHVCHVPKILYHWRASQASIAASVDNKSYIYTRAELALAEYLASQDLTAEINRIDDYLIYNVEVIEPKAKLNTIIFQIQSENKAWQTAWHALMDNLKRAELYDIYVIDSEQMFHLPTNEKNINVTKFEHITDALSAFTQKTARVTKDVLFLTSAVTFVDQTTLSYLLQISQIMNIDVVAPTVVNQDMVITEAGRIILSQDTLGFSSYGVPFGQNDYFGNNLSLVNYSFVSPDCFMMKTDLIKKIRNEDIGDTLMELLLNLRSHEVFYCVNVGNRCVQHTQDDFAQTYVRSNNEKIVNEEKFYNKNFVQKPGLLYKYKN